MKSFVGWGPALLVALFHAHLLRLGGAANLHRKKQPAGSVVRKLRSDLEARTEELASQKNIAHGLELEVRELQSELQTEKKALATETQKEKVLQRKLNRVRAVLDDGVNSGSSISSASSRVKVARTDKGSSTQAVNDVAAMPRVSAPPNLEDSMEPLPVVSEAELEAPTVAPAVVVAVPPTVPQANSQGLSVGQAAPQGLKPRLATPVQAPPEEVSTLARTRQTTPQEPPPFFEAAAIQSVPASKRLPPKIGAGVAHEHKRPKRANEARATKTKRQVAFRGSSRVVSKKPAAKAQAVQQPAAVEEEVDPAATSQPVVSNTAAAAKEGGSSDFDALEAQLHEEDRRIQDLDRENALDAMTDGGLPPSPGSPQPAANARALAAQPKLELDAEAPMDDFLNVESPGTDASVEAAAAGSDAASADAAMALPQVSEGVGGSLDGALSDNQFLSQIAPGKK
jgi:hypothetical protein